MKISKILSVGDYVYSAYDGRPMKVQQMNEDGFETEEDFLTGMSIIYYFICTSRLINGRQKNERN